MLRIHWVGNCSLKQLQGPISVVPNQLNIHDGCDGFLLRLLVHKNQRPTLTTRSLEQLANSNLTNVPLNMKHHETNFASKKFNQVPTRDPSNPICPITHIFPTSIQIMFRKIPLIVHTFLPNYGTQRKPNRKFGANRSFPSLFIQFRSYRSPKNPQPSPSRRSSSCTHAGMDPSPNSAPFGIEPARVFYQPQRRQNYSTVEKQGKTNKNPS